jgi:S-adenosylmethionine synthetase
MSDSFIFTSESVSEGHPDKVCDFIADSILDAHLEQDPRSHVACEVLCKDQHVILAGEITSNARVDVEAVTRAAIREIGYTDPQTRFHADGVKIQNLLGAQSKQIAQGVDLPGETGAGDQGLVFGFATLETPELMPLPISLAHRITRALARARKDGDADWIHPDSKAQVSVRYEDGKPVEVTDVVVSTQHAPGTPQEEIHAFVGEKLLPASLDGWWHNGIRRFVNPTGEFSIGGPEGDCGVTGRKIIVDTYGGYARHGGGAFSGKDATKVDRSAAYFARFVARQIVLRGLAECAEIQIAYAIGVAQPVSIHVDTRGTGDGRLAEQYARRFDFRPAAIIEQLDLLRPIYRSTTNYGHFGKPTLKWEL